MATTLKNVPRPVRRTCTFPRPLYERLLRLAGQAGHRTVNPIILSLLVRGVAQAERSLRPS